MSFSLESPAFEHNALIPLEYTCEGDDKPPPLIWHNPPPHTQSFVLIMDDPDAPMGARDIISVALVHLLKTTEAKKINVLIKIIKGPEGNPVN
ncbi:hypothetical protein A6J40_14400 [Legionella longbeachae]|uniref:hypothetical protein n=1 Tax=Legionella longbeachae TaxID=450 RepID=UPI0002E9ED9F|nr:hypothetical protein A6J40_14400 [Legionella longbeachae]VEE03847.1 phosphatidylethanolamine-binding protein [Legionella oakridgensis]HBD7397371.1 hypothetical protein [Legionella pneumophila]ARM33643.1 hypothetical protein B0B39_08940 [Legionella longbeachae]QIN33514.1 hypothetical protein GCB94_15850 [Legionella longbeachae]